MRKHMGWKDPFERIWGVCGGVGIKKGEEKMCVEWVGYELGGWQKEKKQKKGDN